MFSLRTLQRSIFSIFQKSKVPKMLIEMITGDAKATLRGIRPWRKRRRSSPHGKTVTLVTLVTQLAFRRFGQPKLGYVMQDKVPQKQH